jgi:hypothetical protein
VAGWLVGTLVMALSVGLRAHRQPCLSAALHRCCCQPHRDADGSLSTSRLLKCADTQAKLLQVEPVRLAKIMDSLRSFALIDTKNHVTEFGVGCDRAAFAETCCPAIFGPRFRSQWCVWSAAVPPAERCSSACLVPQSRACLVPQSSDGTVQSYLVRAARLL